MEEIKDEKVRLHRELYEEYKNKRERALSGKINCIPSPFPRFKKIFPGIEKGKNIIVTAGEKVGKCFGINTPVVMFDGSIKCIQNIKVGDYLLGPDSKPRIVSNTTKGTQEMFKISQKYGKEFIVNGDHILYLRDFAHQCNVTMSVYDYLKLENKFNYRCIQSNEVTFNNYNKLPIDPYFYGLWLGDGDTKELGITNSDKEIIDYIYNFAEKNNCEVNTLYNIRHYLSEKTLLEGYDNNNNVVHYNSSIKAANYNKNISCYISRATNNGKTVLGYKWRWLNKKGDFRNRFKEVSNFNKNHINTIYLKASLKDRYKLLAGILDTDGHKITKNNSYELTLKQESLIDDISFLCRSLGLRVSKTIKIVSCIKYYKIHISGKNCYKIPILVERKKCIKPIRVPVSNLYRNFNIESIGVSDYYGFTVDKDHLFLLDDFTIVHNSQLTDFMFLLHPVMYAYKNRDSVKVKILYFSLEMSVQAKLSQFTCYWLYMFSKGKIRIDIKKLNSLDEESPLAEEVLQILDSKEYKDFFDFLEDTVLFYDDIRNRYGIYKECVNYALAHGKLKYRNMQFKNKDSGIFEERKVIEKYEPDDPELYMIKIVDHVSLYNPEKGRTLREDMKIASSQDNLLLRNIYKFACIDVQQQAKSKGDNDSYKLDRLTPSTDGLADNKTTVDDCNIMLGIFSPWRFNKSAWSGYNIADFKDNIRFLEVIVDRNGLTGTVCPLYFDGAVNFFSELPMPTDTNSLEYYKNLALKTQNI